MVYSPLSLEEFCLLSIICHLGDIPAETVALLPLKFRKRLLLNLPVADVCRLEKTDAVNGIDMSRIWCAHGPRMHPSLTGIECPLGPDRQKEFCFMAAVTIALEGNLRLACFLLFAVYRLDLQRGTGITSSLLALEARRFVPRRYYGYFMRSYSIPHLLQLIMKTSHYRLPVIRLTSSCTLSTFTVNEQVPMGFKEQPPVVKKTRRSLSHQELGILQDALSEVHEFHLYCPSSVPTSLVSLMLEAILSSERPSLHTLFWYGSSAKPSMLTAIIPMFSQGDYTPTHFTRDSLKSLPYHGLEHLQLHEGRSYDAKVLTSLIQTRALRTIELSLDTCTAWGTPRTFSCDFYSLSSFVQQPQFCLIKLSSINIPLPRMQEIIDTFLMSPASHEQALHFSEVYVSDPSSYADSATQDSKVSLTLPQRANVSPPTNANFKQMYFHRISARSSFLSWLLTHPSLVLDTLCINEFRPLYSPNDLEDKRAVEFAIQHSELRVRNLLFSFIESHDSLVEMSYRYLGGKGLFHCLIETVQHLACRNYTTHRVRTNCFQLFYTDCQIGSQPDEQVCLFFKALFSLLAKVRKLDVTFTNNCFVPRHLEMMYQSWQENAEGKELNRLSITELPTSQINPGSAKALLKEVATDISIALE